MKNFVERLDASSRRNQSLVCVGLDPDPDLMAVPDVTEFNKSIVDATKDLVCAFKPNLSFYEALGLPGLKSLDETISYIRAVAPEVVIVGDAKRGDIASTNVMYARAMFDVWGFDAATVNAYGGGEALEPFLEYEDRGIIIWCRSSNPGAREIQDMALASGESAMPLYEWMAKLASGWNSRGNIGLVVGSTYPDELKSVRARCPGMPVLIPGIGAQGGDLESSVKLGLDKGRHNIMISSSRGIIYASSNAKEYTGAARDAAQNLRDRINRILLEEGRGW